MNIGRRELLFGLGAVLAGSVVPAPALANGPIIYGDGIHDDGPGLSALVSGQPFRIAQKGRFKAHQTAGAATLRGGCFRLATAIRVAERAAVSISGAHLIMDQGVLIEAGEGCALKFEGCLFTQGRFARPCLPA